MSKRLVVRPKAQSEIDHQAEYIALENPAAARRFLAAAEETFQSLTQMPTLGRSWGSPHKYLEGVRVWRVKGFEKHLVFYRSIISGIDVLHVLHGAQDLPTILDTPGNPG